MKIQSILFTALIINGLSSKSQNINSLLNKAKDAAITNSTSIIDAAKSNTTASNVINKAGGLIGQNKELTNDEVIKGLKEALTVGTNNSAASASKVDGYLKNQDLFIPWPAEAKEMREKLIKMGMQKKVTDFETSMNRAAEEAAKKASPIFIDAVTNMTIGDGFAILNGSDSSATHYLREKTFSPLKEKFMPVINEAIIKTKVTSYWAPLATAYNKIPGVKKQNPNLNDYVCTKAINGLMILVLNEEGKIRKDPAARVSDILKKVFGYKK